MNLIYYLLVACATGLAIYMFMDLHKKKNIEWTIWMQLVIGSLLWPFLLIYVLWLKLLYKK